MSGIPEIRDVFMGAVTVGERGQVVIPVAARERCSIQAGDKLLVLVHPSHGGVWFVKVEAMAMLNEAIQELAANASTVSEEAGEQGGA